LFSIWKHSEKILLSLFIHRHQNTVTENFKRRWIQHRNKYSVTEVLYDTFMNIDIKNSLNEVNIKWKQFYYQL